MAAESSQATGGEGVRAFVVVVWIVALVSVSLSVKEMVQDYKTVGPAEVREQSKPLNDPLVKEAVAVADSYWHIGNEKDCLELRVYDDSDENIAARGDQPGCTIYFNQDFLDLFYEKKKRDPDGAFAWLCYISTHERGHNLGHPHQDGTVMQSPADIYLAPQECLVWALDMQAQGR